MHDPYDGRLQPNERVVFTDLHCLPMACRINYISPIKWGAWILANLAFDDVTFTCEHKINGRCPIADGQQVRLKVSKC